MQWGKRGLIYGPDGSSSWAKHSALTPTPVLLNENTIRVFAGFRDEKGISRIGFVDVDAENPSIIKNVSKTPILDIGRPGAFDDNGVILGDVIPNNDKLYMYYVGFQLVKRVKFLAFTGLAISHDAGNSFERYSNVPILDRSQNGLYIRAIHSVMKIKDRFHAWCAAGNGWEVIDGMLYPQYNIQHLESDNGFHFIGNGEVCVDVEGSEYRIGRPRVFHYGEKFLMHYTRGTRQGDYFAGLAESDDGVKWTRIDDKLGISLSCSGWDSRHLCYPSVLKVRDKLYMFYNGNDMGKNGFGYALLEQK